MLRGCLFDDDEVVPLADHRARVSRAAGVFLGEEGHVSATWPKEEAATSFGGYQDDDAHTSWRGRPRVGNLRDRLPCRYCPIRVVGCVVVVVVVADKPAALPTRAHSSPGDGQRTLRAGGGGVSGGGPG